MLEGGSEITTGAGLGILSTQLDIRFDVLFLAPQLLDKTLIDDSNQTSR